MGVRVSAGDALKPLRLSVVYHDEPRWGTLFDCFHACRLIISGMICASMLLIRGIGLIYLLLLKD